MPWRASCPPIGESKAASPRNGCPCGPTSDPGGTPGPNDVFAYVIARNKRSVLIDDDIAAHPGSPADFYFSIVVKDTGAGGNGQMLVCDPTIRIKQLM
jgi:hypothetical protein